MKTKNLNQIVFLLCLVTISTSFPINFNQLGHEAKLFFKNIHNFLKMSPIPHLDQIENSAEKYFLSDHNKPFKKPDEIESLANKVNDFISQSEDEDKSKISNKTKLDLGEQMDMQILRDVKVFKSMIYNPSPLASSLKASVNVKNKNKNGERRLNDTGDHEENTENNKTKVNTFDAHLQNFKYKNASGEFIETNYHVNDVSYQLNAIHMLKIHSLFENTPLNIYNIDKISKVFKDNLAKFPSASDINYTESLNALYLKNLEKEKSKLLKKIKKKLIITTVKKNRSSIMQSFTQNYQNLLNTISIPKEEKEDSSVNSYNAENSELIEDKMDPDYSLQELMKDKDVDVDIKKQKNFENIISSFINKSNDDSNGISKIQAQIFQKLNNEVSQSSSSIEFKKELDNYKMLEELKKIGIQNHLKIYPEDILKQDEIGYNNDYFSYNFDNEIVISNQICIQFISEIDIFQVDMSVNNFICKYLAAILEDGYILDTARYNKFRLGKELKELINSEKSRFEKVFLKINSSTRVENIKELEKSLDECIPDFLQDLIIEIEYIAKKFTELIDNEENGMINELSTNLSQEFSNINLDFDKAQSLVSMSFHLYKENPFLYKQSLYEIVHTYQNALSEDITSTVYDVLPGFININDNQYCSLNRIFIANYFISDCAAILMKFGVIDLLESKCMSYFNKVFTIGSHIPNFCEFTRMSISYTEEILKYSIIEFVKNIYTNKEIDMLNLGKDIFDHIKKSMDDIESSIELYKHYTNTKNSLVNKNKLKLYPLFNRLKYILQSSYNLKEKVDCIDNKIYQYLDSINKYKIAFTIDVSSIISEIYLDVSYLEKSEIIKIRKRNLLFEQNMIEFCVSSSPIYMSYICIDVFDKMQFPFIYKYHNYDFVFDYLIAIFHDLVKNFDIENNNVAKLTSFLKVQMQTRINNISEELVNDFQLFSPDILKVVPIDVLNLIIIFIKIYCIDTKFTISQSTILQIQSFIETRKDFLSRVRFEYGLDETFEELGQFLLSLKTKAKYIDVKNIIIFFIKNFTEFSDSTKNTFMVNLDQIYNHHNNWDLKINQSMENFKKGNFMKMMIQCKDDHYGTSLECRSMGRQNIFVYTSCPPFSQELDKGICFNDCPVGFEDVGFFCKKPQVIFKKFFDKPEKCESNLGCTKLNNGLYVENCPPQFLSISVFCFPNCPFGMIDQGKTCKKNIIGGVSIYY